MSELEVDAGQRATARLVGAALVSGMPPETAERHEAMLRTLTSGGAAGRGPRSSPRRVAVLALAAAMVLGTSIVAFAADGSVPGDALYGIDRAIERLQLAIARSPEAKAVKQLEMAAERLQEIRVLQKEHAPVRRIAQTARAAVEANAQALEDAGRTRDLERSIEVLAQADSLFAELREVHSSLQGAGAGGAAAVSLEKELDSGTQALEKVRTRRPRGDGGPGKSRIERSRDDTKTRGSVSARRSRDRTPASPAATPSEAPATPNPTPSTSPSPSPTPSPTPSGSPVP